MGTTPSPLATSLLRDVLDSESYNERSPSHITLASPSIERAFDSTTDITPMKRLVEQHRADGMYVCSLIFVHHDIRYSSIITNLLHLIFCLHREAPSRCGENAQYRGQEKTTRGKN